MHEIKFRAWDKDRKKMVFGAPEVNPKDCGNLIYCDMETIAIGLEGDLYLVDECGNYEYPANWDNDYNYELMQYTGLKDKNGKEIYEGDIVRFPVAGGELVCKEVFFTRGTFTTAQSLIWGLGHSCTEEGVLGDVEVTGNKYENPELLES